MDHQIEVTRVIHPSLDGVTFKFIVRLSNQICDVLCSFSVGSQLDPGVPDRSGTCMIHVCSFHNCSPSPQKKLFQLIINLLKKSSGEVDHGLQCTNGCHVLSLLGVPVASVSRSLTRIMIPCYLSCRSCVVQYHHAYPAEKEHASPSSGCRFGHVRELHYQYLEEQGVSGVPKHSNIYGLVG